MPETATTPLAHRRQYLGFILGPLVMISLLTLSPPTGLDIAAWQTAAITLLMAIWWITEALPIPVTALLPLVLFPLLGIADIQETAIPYANPLIFLFMGGFIIALAIERCGLHRRLAYCILSCMGISPAATLGGFMVVSAFLSLWISNTATTMLMLPIACSVIEGLRGTKAAAPLSSPFAVALLLGIAYSASIGGLGTLVGTVPNALLAGFVLETYGFELGFAEWMLLAAPFLLVLLVFAWFMLTQVVFSGFHREHGDQRVPMRQALRQLGPVSRAERRVTMVFALVAILWLLRPLIATLAPNVALNDPGIALFGAMLLFLIPLDWRRGRFLMDWKTAEQLPWGTLLLFGGGLSLAASINNTGLASWLGGNLTLLSGLPAWLILLGIVAVVIFLTELTSNTATTSIFLPILGSVALSLGQPPLQLLIPVTLAVSCAFMMPVATPPNAIVFGTGLVSIPQMARAGFYLNLASMIIITGVSYWWVPVLFTSPLP
ncbi:Sodium/sulphate symporter [Nitrosococcus oceani ATCC 19707]|uniref:Sodium/sulphate symporter n=2 Tax=Nitrosococcus oceani TaxID=1229 RepID=Q3J8E6_NITOC|nr:DASS family sodium-coupled anion symporter [Nitrosococcus oceani]ABA58900.1 Sodium/sulphate symporter [Nitrosococcus oceani ATCC 19707]EDZ68178.1 transporter, DASS family [Nitrosococcus oceani AFC27]KFI18700.1 anion transporter [Nitrosococcus oceani C-27]GEM19005.1 anion transporter [Nitrosococcus oceani]